jgi:hypothetical protein
MPDKLTFRPQDPYLTANVTPWWWENHWALSSPKMVDAFRIVRALPWCKEATVTVSMSGLVLSIEIPNGTDVEALHEMVRELKLFLNEMVPFPAVTMTAQAT